MLNLVSCLQSTKQHEDTYDIEGQVLTMSNCKIKRLRTKQNMLFYKKLVLISNKKMLQKNCI